MIQRRSLTNVRTIMIPEQTQAQTVEDRTWTCVAGEEDKANGVPFIRLGCGVIRPKIVGEYVIRLHCPCEKQAFKDFEEKKARLQWEKEQLPLCYDWLDAAPIAEEMAMMTFDNFDHTRQPEAYVQVQSFTDILSGSMILHGPYGTGKTHLLAALCNELRTRKENPISSRFATTSALFNAIQKKVQKDEPYYQFIEIASKTPLLVLDDVSPKALTDFREETLFQILNTRVIKKKPTVISINDLSKLPASVGGRCASRLQIGLIEVEMSGDDYRIGL